MPDDYKKDLIAYRIERAHECIKDAENDLYNNSLYSAANRLYYGVFNAMRALLANDGVNFSKHAGVIAYIRGKFIKTGLIDAKFSNLIRDAEALRNDCDYSDFYTPEKEDLEKQLTLLKEFLVRTETITTNE